jgi:hypothetical protein
MNRCMTRSQPGGLKARWAASTCLLCLLSAPVLAQNPTGSDTYFRPFPPHALRGVLRVTQSPEILLNGKPDLLSPGARIRDTENRIVMSQQLAGQDLRVNYTREAAGGVHDVWILTPAEQTQARATGQ